MWAFLGYLSFVQIPFFKEMIIFLKLAFWQDFMETMFSPGLVCLRILITLLDDSLESIVDAPIFHFWDIYREGGDWLDFVKQFTHAENFGSLFSQIPVGGGLLTSPWWCGMCRRVIE